MKRDKMIQIKSEVMFKAEEEFKKEIEKVKKKDEEEKQVIRKIFGKRYFPQIEKLTKSIEINSRRLFDLSSFVVPTILGDRMELIQICSTWEFGTQTNVTGYVVGKLKPLEGKLKDLGIKTHIQKNFKRKSSYNRSIYYSGRAELWANIPKWQAEAIKQTITISEAKKSWGVLNHHVLMQNL